LSLHSIFLVFLVPWWFIFCHSGFIPRLVQTSRLHPGLVRHDVLSEERRQSRPLIGLLQQLRD